MIKLLTTHRTAWIGFFIALLSSFIMAVTTHAQESPEDLAQKYNISFPVAELGGCTDYSECRSFCEDPLNAESCINYAKQKGFYQEEKFEVKDNVLQTAKEVLGCDSKTSCLNFCEVAANHDKCDSFAKSQGLVGGRVDDPSRTQVITKAKEVLGCDSATGCQSLCSKEENRQKCSDFAKTVGLHGGEIKVGPGGCTSETTCKSFCSDPQNFQVCSGFTSVAGGKFTGPGGCDSEANCRSYCQSNEKACSSFFGGPGGGGAIQTKYDPVDMCNRTPNCAWTGNTCQCGFYGETNETVQKAGEYAGYCRANPDKCRVGQTGGFDTTAQRQEFESYCSQNPDKCKPPTGGTGHDYFDPATECTRYGCSWTNNNCQCGGIKDYDPAAQCSKSPGCSWNNNSCNCGPYSYPTPYGGQYSPTPYSYPTPYSAGGPGSCREPSGGCPSGWYWNASACSCNPSAGSYPTPGGPSCREPSGGCPSGWTWVSSACSCNYTGGGNYSYPTPYGGTYSYPTPYNYTYPTPYGGSYSYPTPYSYSYPTPYNYSYPTPQAYSYPTPQAYSYPTPQQYSYPTPEVYSYPTPQSYSYPTPSGVQGLSIKRNLWDQILDWFRFRR